MSPRSIGAGLLREVPLLRSDQDLASAVDTIVQARVPALPVVDASGALAGIFGEREFIGAIFPAYLGTIRYAGFVTDAAQSQLELREECRSEPVSKYMNTEHIDVGPDYADAQLAEVFLHHRVLIVPVTDDGRVVGIVTRWDLFAALADRIRSRDQPT